MSNFKFETTERAEGIFAAFYYEDVRMDFLIEEEDLEKLIEKIFEIMPFDTKKETLKEFEQWLDHKE